MNVSGTTLRAGVVGWPVAHSLSPALHGYWISQHGLDATYEPFAVRPEAFALALPGLALQGVCGVNVTLPHKEAAFQLVAGYGGCEYRGVCGRSHARAQHRCVWVR